MSGEHGVLRDLAKQVKEAALSERMNKRREQWRLQNSFQGERPLIYLRAFAFEEFFEEASLISKQPVLRSCEKQLRQLLFRDNLDDDFIIEPWVTIEAVYEPTSDMRWGVSLAMGEKPINGGASAYMPKLLDEDFSMLKAAPYKVDEEATRLKKELLEDALDGELSVYVTRQGPYWMWNGDISTDIAKMRGLEQLMWDAYDRPEWLSTLLSFMRDTILKGQEEAENAGGYSLADHQNQAMPYASDMKDPTPNSKGVLRKDLWWYMAAQEFTGFSGEMFYEFMLKYQMPIMENFGLIAYGCCEDVTAKIPYLKRIKNLRRIAVSPFSNAKSCAEQIGRDYILSWRPNPSLMLATGLDEPFVRKYMREHFDIFKQNHCHFDITLKDVETVNHQPENIGKWVKMVREEIENAF